MNAGLLMLSLIAWVLMSALLAALVALVGVVHAKTEELRGWSFESDDSDDWLV